MIFCVTGIDGSGKSCQVDLLYNYLVTDAQKKCFVSKAYGENEKKLFAEYLEHADQLTIMFLFQALHVQQRIKAEEHVSSGSIVIADRWDDTYLAYHSQNGFLKKDEDLRIRLNKIAFAEIKPKVTFLLDVSVEVAQKRIKDRSGIDKSFFDEKKFSYYEKFRKGFLSLANDDPHWQVIDGEKSKQAIHLSIREVVKKELQTNMF